MCIDIIFFFKQKTAYEMRISDWSSDVCSSDLLPNVPHYVAAYYGILKLGATVVNFSPLYTAQELAHQVADSGTRLMFTLSATALLPTALRVLATSALDRLIVGSVEGALDRKRVVSGHSLSVCLYLGGYANHKKN